MFTTFMPPRGVVVIKAAALDPYYRDMPEGESWFTSERGMMLSLPSAELMALGAIAGPLTKWRYEQGRDAGGLTGWKITKLSPDDAA